MASVRWPARPMQTVSWPPRVPWTVSVKPISMPPWRVVCSTGGIWQSFFAKENEQERERERCVLFSLTDTLLNWAVFWALRTFGQITWPRICPGVPTCSFLERYVVVLGLGLMGCLEPGASPAPSRASTAEEALKTRPMEVFRLESMQCPLPCPLA